MQRIVIALVTLIVGLIASPGGIWAQEPVSSARNDLTTAEASTAINLIFEGKTGTSTTFLDSLAVTRGGEPLFLIVKSRVLRELLTIDDENKDLVKADSGPILEDLDRLIDMCNDRIEAGDDDPELRLYRGMAWMFKSQVRSFGRSFWRAGRDAKKGKKDLEAYLKRFPDDHLVLGTLGAFYYFADMIPGMFKFLSRLVFMPSGDREKGLLYIEQAAAGESIFKTDFEILLYTVYFMFEGRYEEGLEGIRSLWNRFPRYERLAAPTLLMRPLIPVAGPKDEVKINALFGEAPDNPAGIPARPEANLLLFLRAYSDRFYKNPANAAAGLRAVSDESFDHPDWVSDYAGIELARLWAAQGRIDRAHPILVEVGAAGSHDYLRDVAKDMLKDLENDSFASGGLGEDWAGKVYGSSSADRRDMIAKFRILDRPSLQASFYLGDALLLEGDLDGALEAFEYMLKRDAPRWGQEYQMLAANRAAEIQGARGDYRAAARSISKALDYYHKEYLLDWIMEGRQRYYERLAKGEGKIPPRLFSSNER